MYFIYILTNYNRTVSYTGVTNNLKRRLAEHKEGLNRKSFTQKYKCFYIIYYEQFQHPDEAIAREKEIKNLTRMKKEKLINEFNPEWKFLNDEVIL